MRTRLPYFGTGGSDGHSLSGEAAAGTMGGAAPESSRLDRTKANERLEPARLKPFYFLPFYGMLDSDYLDNREVIHLDKATFSQIEKYMLECMKDSAHDKEHVYRVLYLALDIAEYESNVNMDVLIAACLLHDIGRTEQFKNTKLRHEQVGSRKAYAYLLENNWPENRALHVRNCILSHRFRSENPPDSIEAKILFDSDKLDAAGTLGIARTLLYKGIVSEPLYSLDKQGNVSDGSKDDRPSFFQEYKYKLERLYDRFYTQRGMQIAKERRCSAVSFYNSMLHEVRSCYTCGIQELSRLIE